MDVFDDLVAFCLDQGTKVARPVRDAQTLFRRLRQLGSLAVHPLRHRACAEALHRSGVAGGEQTPLRYLGDYAALSLGTEERRQAMMAHYERLSALMPPSALAAVAEGVLLWRKEVEDAPPLSLFLEPAKFAPMEGELQLRFAFRSDLFVLTFLLSPGELFGSASDTVLFIGGLQGKFFAREEMREASRLNGEISPATMLIIAIQAIARTLELGELIGVGEANHDYGSVWTEAGGVRLGRHYRLPLETPEKPLSDLTSHRSRTRRKREAKAQIRTAIETRLRELVKPQGDDGSRPSPTHRPALSALVHP